MTAKILTQARLKEVLHYAPDTGKFTNVMPRMGATVGKEAGSVSHGYLQMSVDGSGYLAHRLAWLYVTGSFPKKEIDHINHVKDDNRIVNLREADRLVNNQNSSIRKDNSSGITGVHWDKGKSKWKATIFTNGRLKFLGYFSCIKLAAIARKDADVDYGFHENHGKKKKFSRSN